MRKLGGVKAVISKVLQENGYLEDRVIWIPRFVESPSGNDSDMPLGMTNRKDGFASE
jgi:hypothetical protein